MRYPSVRNADELVHGGTQISREVDGKWVVARPEGYPSFRHRIKTAWLVFTGKADALTYTGQ